MSNNEQQELAWEDLPTFEELDRIYRENRYSEWCRAFSVWLTNAIKQNVPPSEFKVHYNCFATAILCVIKGDLPGDNDNPSQRLIKKLCSDLHKAIRPSISAAIFDTYSKGATQYRARDNSYNNTLSRIAILPTHLGSVLHFCDQGNLIKTFCFYAHPEDEADDESDEWSLSLDHPDAIHWYLNAGFIEVADALQGTNIQ